MKWQELLTKLKDDGLNQVIPGDNPTVEFYTVQGHQMKLVEVYVEDGVVCVDFERVD